MAASVAAKIASDYVSAEPGTSDEVIKNMLEQLNLL
jgi:hypothetical protein